MSTRDQRVRPRGRGWGRYRSGATATAALLMALGSATVVVASQPTAAGAATSPSLTVTPSTGLVSNRPVSVVVTGASPGSTIVAVECDPTAFTLLGEGASPSDACDSRHNAVLFVDAAGVAAGTVNVQAVMTTALGAADCRTEQCFVAVESYYTTGASVLLVDDLTFSAMPCPGPTSCATPDDAWDPSLGGPPTGSADPAGAATAVTEAATTRTKAPKRTGKSTPGTPLTVPITAGQAGALTGTDDVTGPYTSTFPASDVPSSPVSGEGLLRLALSAPHTHWGAKSPSSTVVDVSLNDVTRSSVVSTQQFVLYNGKPAFTYGGFTGPISTGDSYSVTVTAEASAANGGQSWPAGTAVPTAKLVDSQLEVVPTSNPQYLAMTYAPVVYGRSTSALHDVPLLVDATATPAAGGATTLSYTVIWSHEDAGTGFVPFLESATWGRLTDIENAISFTVAPGGTVSGASYLWGGEPGTGFPDSQGALQEVNEPFTGTWDGTHPVLRDATGNNDFSPAGTTPFRFQLAPVPGPATGQAREAVMDAHPFTYRISGEEVARWYGDLSTNPASTNLGDLRQYATVDLNTSGSGVASVAVALQLSGGPTWYASDYFSSYPTSGIGHYRTMVKLPVGWQDQSITGVRVLAYPSSPTGMWSTTVNSLTVSALSSTWDFSTETVPTPTVVAATPQVPAQLDLAAKGSTMLAVKAGKTSGKMHAVVTDGLGAPLAGVPVTFTAGTGGTFSSCGCSTATATTSAKGVATSPGVKVGATASTVDVTAATADTVAGTLTYSLRVA